MNFVGSHCTVDGCGRPVRSRGLCSAHYHKLQRYGDPLHGYSLGMWRGVICRAATCDRDAKKRGFCNAHHWRLINGLPVDVPLRVVRKGTPIERVLARIDATAVGCWPWPGGSAKGYGRVRGGPKNLPVHRVTYEHFVGPIPDSYEIDHLCRNTLCCNPAHLEAVTQAENLRRKDEALAIGKYRTHCPSGHEYTPENTYARATGRVCRECIRLRNERYRLQRRAA